MKALYDLKKLLSAANNAMESVIIGPQTGLIRDLISRSHEIVINELQKIERDENILDNNTRKPNVKENDNGENSVDNNNDNRDNNAGDNSGGM